MVIRQGAGAALNPDGAARHELRMLRHPLVMEGQPIGRSASLGKRLGGSPLRIETAAFLQHGCLTRAASGARSKRDGTSRCGDRHVRHPPSFCNQNGKCHKDRLVPSPRCKRGPFGQEVRFRPLPTIFADVVYWLGLGAPLRRGGFDSRRPHQTKGCSHPSLTSHAEEANLVKAPR